MTRSPVPTLVFTAVCTLGLISAAFPARAATGLAVQPVAGVARAPHSPIRLRSTAAADGLDSAVTGEADETCEIHSLKCNTTVSSSLTNQDCSFGDGTYFDPWQFAGVGGATVTISLNSTSFDPYLLLLDPDFNDVAEDNDSGPGKNARIVQTLGSTGVWTIWANNWVPGKEGNYTLTLTCDATSPPPAAPAHLAATAVNSSSVLLTWQDNSNNETGFVVEQQVVGGSFFPLPGDIPTDSAAALVTGVDPSSTETFRVRARNPEGDSDPSNEATATTLAPGQPCVPSDTTLCIDDMSADRKFEIRVNYQNTQQTPQGEKFNSGPGKVKSLAPLGIDQGGVVSFFESTNPELLIKVLNVCLGIPGFNGYWVFYSAGTNVGFTVIVRKTDTDDAIVYLNRDGTPAPPVQDTDGFACN